jgi:predicted acylesterase/phospholipase RssA
MLGVAFEGCACRASFHAGVAAGLTDGGLVPEVTAGASSGSLAAAGIAAGADMPRIWQTLADRKIWSLRRIAWNRSIFDMSWIVRSTLEETLGRTDLRGKKVEALAVATRARDLTSVVYSSKEEEDFIEPLLGSCFFPVFYGRAVRVRGELMLDGGLRANLPLEPLRARGCDEVIAVVTRPSGEALMQPFRWAKPRLDGAKLHVIRPRERLDVRSWDLDGGRMRRALDEGYAAARAFLGS